MTNGRPRNIDSNTPYLFDFDGQHRYEKVYGSLYPNAKKYEAVAVQWETHDQLTILATHHGEVIGQGSLCWNTSGDDPEPVLCELWVHPLYRGNGVGLKLQELREDMVKLRGHRECFLSVKESSWLYWLYVSRGYTYDRPHSTKGFVWMYKQLDEWIYSIREARLLVDTSELYIRPDKLLKEANDIIKQ